MTTRKEREEEWREAQEIPDSRRLRSEVTRARLNHTKLARPRGQAYEASGQIVARTDSSQLIEQALIGSLARIPEEAGCFASSAAGF